MVERIDMKAEEDSLTGYLAKNLEPLTEADPVILAKYVAALLKKDKPTKELQKLCEEKLVEFLGQGTQPFITELFKALEDGSIPVPSKGLDAGGQAGTSQSLMAEDPLEINSSMLRTGGLSPSGCVSDPEDKEISDDDDDDRNHKHRRRETRSQSSEKGMLGPILRRPNKKQNGLLENGAFLGNDPQSSEHRKEYNLAILDRDFSAKLEKKRPGLAPLPRAPFDLGPRPRLNQAFRGDLGQRFDLSASLGRLPIGRGRGRNSGPWSQNDSKFSTFDALDFASQMVPQGPNPSLFASRGLQPFGLIPAMPNGGLDGLHPLSLQGTLGPSINQSLNINLPRQRCRDFEERGFCLRGDMCPMEHGVNRIVVDDVQSLSQFNLPVSLPSAHLLGSAAGTGTLPSGAGSSSLMTASKPVHGKSNKPGTTDDASGLNGMFSAAGASEADFYDPDQPLWNKDHPQTSTGLVGLSSPKFDDESLWSSDHSDRHNFKLSAGMDSEHIDRSFAPAIASQAGSSVWGRIGNSRSKPEMAGKPDGTVASMDCPENETKQNQEEALVHKRKQNVSEDVDAKAIYSAAQRPQSDSARKSSQKAVCTLFVNGIPLKNNKTEALLSHFRKFGEVIDIYIPMNSEKAFIQFSKREEAEAALRAPDAVMGNRFIKLWWANRDSIPVNGMNSGNATTAAVAHGGPIAIVDAQLPGSDGGKGNLDSAHPKSGAPSSSDVPALPAIHPRPVAANGPKVIPQKKLENLEILKEELRQKQEMLDQKRNDFRRLLDKIEKKTSSVKDDIAEQTVKRYKVEATADVLKASTPKSVNANISRQQPVAEKLLEKANLGDNIVSSSPRSSATIALQSPRSLKPPVRLSAPLGTPVLANRFKLDNRPTAFKILPPLPAELANVAALKEFFSPFGDLSAVELEDPEAGSTAACSGQSEKLSARIMFRTRHSAERAFSNGKNWKGHNLHLSWLTTSNKLNNQHSTSENSPTPTTTTTPKDLPNAEVLAETATSGSSSSSVGRSASSVSSAAACTGESDNCEGTKDSSNPMDITESCLSIQVPLASSETQHLTADGPTAEEGLDIRIQQ